MASAQATAKAGALYIIESTNATFVNANTLVLTGASPTTTYRCCLLRARKRRHTIQGFVAAGWKI